MNRSLQPRLASNDRPNREAEGGQDRYRTAIAAGIAVAAVYLIVVVYSVSTRGYDTWGGVVVAPCLFIFTAPLLRRMLLQVEPDPRIRRVVLLGFGAKLLGAYARFASNEYLLGRGDAFAYHVSAIDVSREFRSFVFGGPAYEQAIANISGTGFIRLLLSGLYTVTGSTRLGGFVVFSFMSFWGLYLFYRAFSIAVPDGLRRRYAMLIFFMPSMLFWPSSVGKEAWMVTMLGLGSYGLARLLTQQRFAYLTMLAAVAGLGIVRPHVAAIFLCGAAVAFVLRRTKGSGRTARKMIGLIVLVVVAGVLMAQLQSFFGLENGLDAQEVFDRASEQTAQGGSEFQSSQPTGIADFPWAVITVLFRPFLYEAGSAAGLVTSLEGTTLLCLFMWNAVRVARVPAVLSSRPYLGYVVAYSLVFAFAFSAVNNFGLLARQRTQLFPLVVAVLAVPIDVPPRGRRDGTARVAASDSGATVRGPVGPRFIG